MTLREMIRSALTYSSLDEEVWVEIYQPGGTECLPVQGCFHVRPVQGETRVVVSVSRYKPGELPCDL